MARMVGNAELLLDDLGDAGAGPDLTAKAVGFRPMRQEVRNEAQLIQAELGGMAGAWAPSRAAGPSLRAVAIHWLTAPSVTSKTTAMSRCFQPSCLRRQACIRRHSRQS